MRPGAGAALLAFAIAASGLQAQDLTIAHVTVVSPGLAHRAADATVRIRDGRIVAIGHNVAARQFNPPDANHRSQQQFRVQGRAFDARLTQGLLAGFEKRTHWRLAGFFEFRFQFGSGAQRLRLFFGRKSVNQRLESAIEHLIELMQRQIHAMVGDA